MVLALYLLEIGSIPKSTAPRQESSSTRPSPPVCRGFRLFAPVTSKLVIVGQPRAPSLRSQLPQVARSHAPQSSTPVLSCWHSHSTQAPLQALVQAESSAPPLITGPSQQNVSSCEALPQSGHCPVSSHTAYRGCFSSAQSNPFQP